MRTLLLVPLAACSRVTVVVYPSELEPLEDLQVDLPQGDALSERVATAEGEDDGLYWSHVRGYVRAPILDVWQAAQEPAVGVNHREVDEWEVTENTVPEFDVSFTVHNTKYDIIRVDWDNTWVYELQAETTEGIPTQAMARWDKTKGTGFIQLLSGTLRVLPTSDEAVTEVQLIYHMRAAQRDTETLTQYLVDLHANLAAASRGEDVPVSRP